MGAGRAFSSALRTLHATLGYMANGGFANGRLLFVWTSSCANHKGWGKLGGMQAIIESHIMPSV